MPTIRGTNDSETIDAMDGVTDDADVIFGYGGIDTIYGLGGNDVIKGGGGADTIDGGLGIDTADYGDSYIGVSVSLVAGWRGAFGTAEGDTLINIENLSGSNYDDNFFGDHNANTLWGMNGDDYLTGGRGADTLNGGSGVDFVGYGDSSEGVLVSLATGRGFGGTAEGDRLIGIERIDGSDYGDMLSGDNGRNQLNGNDGNDVLDGGDEKDALFGGIGTDKLKGGGGDDFLDGGFDTDTMLGGTGNDVYLVSSWTDVVTEAVGEGSRDEVRARVTYALAEGSEIEVLKADAPGTTPMNLFGNEFGNTLIGNDGRNELCGSLIADGGGYDGLDVMTGNGGNDFFIWFSGAESSADAALADVITDFDQSENDVIHVRRIDADGDASNGDQDFTFVGTNPYSGVGQISYYNTATDTFIQFNLDADETPEMLIKVAGLHTPDAGWFVG